MSLLTLEVEIDHGRVVVKGSGSLPEKASALLTILPARDVANDELVLDPAPRPVVFLEGPPPPLVLEHGESAPAGVRNGIRLFPLREGVGIVTPELVRALLEESA